MAEKITRTHAERDALLSKVFDSTLQTKDIEITEAGTTEITPDEGFFALKKVNLNVNVQGGGSSIEYLDVSGIDIHYEIPMSLGALAKFTQTRHNSNELAYKGIADAFTMAKHSGYDGVIKITALAMLTDILDLPIKVIDSSTGKVTDEGIVKNLLDAVLGGTITQILNCPRITKEEFYAM